MTKQVTYKQFRKVLESLGYAASGAGVDHLVFRNPERRLLIVLPRMTERQVVRPIDMLSVRKTLANDGVMREDEFESLFLIRKGDRLIWTEPTTGKQVRVTAAAGESDGFVVIKQKGAFMPCPVNQLMDEKEYAANARARNH